MKLNCGLSAEEKWEIEYKKCEKEMEDVLQWHDWFAWYPVRVAHKDCRWLETVKRRATHAVIGENMTLFLRDTPEAWVLSWEWVAKDSKED